MSRDIAQWGTKIRLPRPGRPRKPVWFPFIGTKGRFLYLVGHRTRSGVGASPLRGGFVSSGTGDETKLRRNETTSASGEDIRKPALRISQPTKRRAKRPNDRGPHDQSSFSRHYCCV